MFTWLLAAVALTQAPSAGGCDAECERAAAVTLIERGETRAAVERLHAAIIRFPDDPALPLLLARSYLAEGNLFWAERGLRDTLVRRPADPEARAWLASIHLRQGDPELMKADLELVPEDGPARMRWHLLEVFRARLVGEADAAQRALVAVPRSAHLYPEDRPVWRFLQQQSDPWWLDPVTGTLEVAAGATSNALAGAPTDPGASGTSSGLATLELHGRLAPPASGALRPVLDLELIGNGLVEETYRELSSLEGSARLGGLLTASRQRLLVGYRAELLLLNQEPSRYAEAHRGELELESSSGWALLAGGGRRTYRDDRRTRWEGDVSVGGPLRLSAAVPLAAGAAVRLADANSPAYDQRGASALLVGRVPIGRGWSTRLALSGSWDDYPHSGGSEGLLVFGTAEKRRDLLGRISVGVWSPRRWVARAGIEWQYTQRDSTADDRPGFDFDYREHRVMARLHFDFDADPWAPRVVRTVGHVPLEWGLEAGGGEQEERILDLLRQDEELRRGSSCMVR